MATEELSFKLELFATYWNVKPKCEIMINNEIKWSDEISGTEDDPTVIEFTHTCEENQKYNLVLNRQGKTTRQTIVEGDKIVKDQLLHIKNIQIDEIDIGGLKYEGVYKPEYPEPWATTQRNNGVELPETLKSSVILGHNGTWTLGFSSPFYMWLLENLY